MPSAATSGSSSRRDEAPVPSPPAFASNKDYLGPISATPQKMVEEMLRMAGVSADDVVFDLGCNDGRVCITAAREHGARGVGIEIDAGAVNKAKRLAGVEELVELKLGNVVRASLRSATVVFVYLLPKGNRKISRKLMRELSPGAVVMTYVFRLPSEEWDAHLEGTKAVSSTRERTKTGVDASSYNKIFMYRVPEKKPRWCAAPSVTETTAGKIVAVGGLVAAAACVWFRRARESTDRRKAVVKLR